MKYLILGILALVVSTLGKAGDSDLNPGDIFKDCDTCPEMVVIPAGEGMAGLHPSQQGYPYELAWRKVSIEYKMAIGKFELLNGEYGECVKDGACEKLIRTSTSRFPNFPVSKLRWIDAQAYIRWLSNKTGRPYRLLSEAEWEYAARGGNSTAYSWGNKFRNDMAVCGHCSAKKGRNEGDIKQGKARITYSLNAALHLNPQTGVNTVPPNPFGLYYMLGNVAEWVADCLDTRKTIQPTNGDASLPKGECKKRTYKGADFSEHRKKARISLGRGSTISRAPVSHVGLRVAFTIN